MPRIVLNKALDNVGRPRAGGFRARARQKLSGTNLEPLGVRKTDLLPSVEEQKVEQVLHERYSAGRKAEWKRRQDVSIILTGKFRAFTNRQQGVRFVDQLIVNIKAGE